MLNIKTAVLNDNDSRNLYVKQLINQSGLARNAMKLVNYIEEDLNGRYGNGESSPSDCSTATYGGVIHDGFRLIENGEVVASYIKKWFTSEEIAVLQEVSGGDLYLSVERSDYEPYQVWNLVFDLCLAGRKDSEAFTLDVELRVSTGNGEIKNLDSMFYKESLVMNDLEHKRLLRSY